MVIGVRRFPEMNRMAFQIVNDSTHDVMATPKDQPTCSVVYRFEMDINMPSRPPIRIARSVSCLTLSP